MGMIQANWSVSTSQHHQTPRISLHLPLFSYHLLLFSHFSHYFCLTFGESRQDFCLRTPWVWLCLYEPAFSLTLLSFPQSQELHFLFFIFHCHPSLHRLRMICQPPFESYLFQKLAYSIWLSLKIIHWTRTSMRASRGQPTSCDCFLWPLYEPR